MAKVEQKEVVEWDAGLTQDGIKWVRQDEAENLIKEHKKSADNRLFLALVLGFWVIYFIGFAIFKVTH